MKAENHSSSQELERLQRIGEPYKILADMGFRIRENCLEYTVYKFYS
jgi:hypothetical protein